MIKKKKISQLPLANSLMGLYTIGVNAANKSVKVSLEWLKKVSDDVAEATKKAISAATSANSAADNATQTMSEISTAAGEVIKKADQAATNANVASTNANNARITLTEEVAGKMTDFAAFETEAGNNETGRVAEEEKRVTAETQRKEAEVLRIEKEKVRDESETERITAETARVEAEKLRVEENKTAVENANAAIEAASSSALNAEEVAAHPTYIGSDHYVYKWNRETKAYDKTDIFTKGDAFSIRKVYSSILEMESDSDNTEVKEGDFVLINTNDVENPDNARLYIRMATGFDFLVDMSGAIGFTGKTPQLGIGTVASGDMAVVTLSEDGTDPSGNPKFKLNLVLPKGEKGDTPVLTAGNVTTGVPGTPASADLVADGTTEDGIPRYRLDMTLPEGKEGKGNMLVDEANLKAGKTYLFKPSVDGSAEGEFIEYVAPVQVQSDWNESNATSDAFIQNKPSSLPANGGNADTLGGQPISIFLTKDPSQNIQVNSSNLTYFGFGYSTNGWPVSGSFISFGGFDDKYQTQIQGCYGSCDLFFRTRNDDIREWNQWSRLAISGEAQPASDVYDWAKQPNKPAYNFDEIGLNIDYTAPYATIRHPVIGQTKDTLGYVSRLALGLAHTGYGGHWSEGLISIGKNDEGTDWTDFRFNISGRINTSLGQTFAFTTDTVEAANKLGVARTINGTYFDGTDNITTEYWGKPRTMAFVNDVTGSVTFDGSTGINVSLQVDRITGTYSGNGGQQPPSYIPSGRVRFSMMNTDVLGDSTYKDWILMDTYSGLDVPVVTAIGISKSTTLSAYIMQGTKGGASWERKAKLFHTGNLGTATSAVQGLMPAADKKKLDRIGSRTTVSTVSGLDVNYETISVTLSANASLSANLTGAACDGWETHVFVQASGAARTVAIPTTGNYISMCGDSVTIPVGKWCEFNLKCIGGIWHIAKMEQE